MEINEDEIKELAELYKACLKETMDTVGLLALGTTDEFVLTKEDLRQIASSIFIQYNINHGKSQRGIGYIGGAQVREKGKDQGRYEGPSTEKQQKAIAAQAMQGARKESIIQNYLGTNGKKNAEELSKSEASTLLDMLYEK